MVKILENCKYRYKTYIPNCPNYGDFEAAVYSILWLELKMMKTGHLQAGKGHFILLLKESPMVNHVTQAPFDFHFLPFF